MCGVSKSGVILFLTAFAVGLLSKVNMLNKEIVS